MNKPPNRFSAAMTANANTPTVDPAAVEAFIRGSDSHTVTAPAAEVPRADVAQIEEGSGTTRIPHKELAKNPWDARRYRDPVKLAELRIDLAKNGQKHAIQVTRKNKQGLRLVIDGHRRWYSNEANGLEDIEAKINPDVDPDDASAMYWLSYSLNNTSETHCDFDDGYSWGLMLAEGTTTLEKIMQETGYAKPTVVQMTSYAKLSPEVLDVIAPNAPKFTYSLAWQLHRLVSSQKNEDAIRLAQAHLVTPMTVKALTTQVDVILSGNSTQRSRKGRILSTPFKWEGKESGEITAYDDGSVELKLANLEVGKQTDLVKRIQEAVEQVMGGAT